MTRLIWDMLDLRGYGTAGRRRLEKLKLLGESFQVGGWGGGVEGMGECSKAVHSANYIADHTRRGALEVVRESARYIERWRNFNSSISENSTANPIFTDLTLSTRIRL